MWTLGTQDRLDGIRQVVLVATLLLGLMFSSLDASIVSTSLVSISLDLQDFLNAPWVVLAYLLAYLGFAIGFAKLSDIYGRRQLICVAWVLFSAFSAGCGLSRSMASLLAQVVLFEVGPTHKPSLLGALIGMTLAVSFVLGPVLGGVISSQVNWRWIFWINVPFGILSFVVMLFAWPRGVGEGQRLSPWDAIRKVDLLGNALILCATTLMVFALQEAGTFTYAWDSPAIVTSLSFASLSWVGFMTWEIFLGVKRHTRVEPILPLRLVTHRVYLGALVCTLFTGYSYLSLLIIIPERFQIVNGENALWSGIHLLPMLGSTAFGSFLAGALSSKRNNTSPTLIAASCLQLAGTGLLSTLSDVTTEIKAQYGYQVVLGLGIGLSLGAATIMTSVQASRADLAVAQGAVAQARVFGGAVGIAVCSILFNTRVAREMAGAMDPADLEALHRSPTITSYLPAAHQQRVRRIYAAAFTADVVVMMGVAAAAALASLATFQRRPPPMPNTPAAAARQQQASKDAVMGMGSSGGPSETELDELVQVRVRG
ncbi:hypothetical protein SLS62_000007 [Diatrype stigma]|uniref:Major facilitator superfamily (MFS) profile domain-containing protein n=1 Tax=Diatrype stigma TaxID=117547 RepID=A0AAN9V150_9PEZI